MEKFHEACRLVVKNQTAKALNYCVNYAKYGLEVSDESEAKVQALYVLSNMTHWRGDDAKRARQLLKEFTKN